MTAKKWLGVLAGVGATLMLTSGAALAHDLKTGKMLPKKYIDRMAQQLQNVQSLGTAEETRGIFEPMFQWPPSYKKLRVCFFGGSDEVRTTIAQLANEWIIPQVGIGFDWGNGNVPRSCDPSTRLDHIRISFDQPGYWSMLGTGSLHYVRADESSMNFEGFDKLTPDQIKEEYSASIVYHEFGHALGLHHEHQSPATTCDSEFDWDYIYVKYGEPPGAWDKATVDNNMRVLMDPDALMTEYDPNSVMKYYFDAKMFKDGEKAKCYSPGVNTKISNVDFATVAYMYPAAQDQWAASYNDRRAKFKALWDKAQASGNTKGVMMNYLDAFYPAE
jgi:hypothetical protein